MIEEIRQAIHNAGQGNKIATFHFQVLIHARELQNYDAVEFCRAVDVPDSYATEFRKMLKLAMIMRDSGADIERTEIFKARTQYSVIPRSFDLAPPALEDFPAGFIESTNHKLELLNSTIDSLKKAP